MEEFTGSEVELIAGEVARGYALIEWRKLPRSVSSIIQEEELTYEVSTLWTRGHQRMRR